MVTSSPARMPAWRAEAPAWRPPDGRAETSGPSGISDLLDRIDGGRFSLRSLNPPPNNSDGKGNGKEGGGKQLARTASCASTLSCATMSDFTDSVTISPASSRSLLGAGPDLSPLQLPQLDDDDSEVVVATSCSTPSKGKTRDLAQIAGSSASAQLAGSSASLALEPPSTTLPESSKRRDTGLVAELRELEHLLHRGSLSEGEYAVAKAQLLGASAQDAATHDVPLPTSSTGTQTPMTQGGRRVQPPMRRKEAWSGRGVSSTHLFAPPQLTSPLQVSSPSRSSSCSPFASVSHAGELRPSPSSEGGHSFGHRAAMVDMALRLAQPNFRSTLPRWGTADGRYAWLLANEGATYNENPASGLTRVGPADYVSHKDHKGAMWGMGVRSHALWHTG
uniref:SHOCT domain-containing protein n=1 Tax=Haptolina brevifila TaxID=156173 RepID=A0A7S2GN54_9EUKA